MLVTKAEYPMSTGWKLCYRALRRADVCFVVLKLFEMGATRSQRGAVKGEVRSQHKQVFKNTSELGRICLSHCFLTAVKKVMRGLVVFVGRSFGGTS